MNDINEVLGAVSKSSVEFAKEAYADIAHPVAQPLGETLGLVPRAIKAALAPVEKWVLQKEYNVAETKKLLEEKLRNVPPEQIEPPEPHVAVPALQYISYCMDNEELRNMYANLLANSMNSVVKNGVHPGFVEIIKQLSPDEAKVLRYFSIHRVVPTITIRYENDNGGGIDYIPNFTDIGEIIGCEHPYDINTYFDNLIRLGLLEKSPSFSSLTNKARYDALKNHPALASHLQPEAIAKFGFTKSSFVEGYMSITFYGSGFCHICLNCQSPSK